MVDGASNDGSQEVLERYRKRLSTLIIEPDSGQADAVAKGLAISQGDILGFLNSDDTLLPGTAKFVCDFFSNNPDVDALYGNRIFTDNADRVTGFWILPPHSNYCMQRWDFIPQETCFWRRSLMQRSGSIDPTFDFALDYDLFVRMMKFGRFQHVHKFLATFRVHDTAKSSTQYETIGRREVKRVQDKEQITLHWYDWFVKYLFGGGILTVSFILRPFAIRRVQKFMRQHTGV